MKYRAVIFDLGGTLVPLPDYKPVAIEIAAILSAPVEKFTPLWLEESEGLGTGIFPDYQSYIKHVCGILGINATDDKIDIAARLPFEETRKVCMIPRDGAIELLKYLKSNDYKTGLISDCATDVPAIWDETPFAPLIDAPVFSCSEGMNKGNSRIFERAVERLEVEPEDCLFIADGARYELANATKVGMHAIQLLIPEEVDYDNPLREQWDGPTISSLREVINLL